MAIIHEINGDEAYSLMSILYSTNGFFTGHINFNRPIRPEMGLSDSIDQQNEVYKLFEEQVVNSIVARYGAVYNTPMIVISQMLAIGRYPTNEEIEHDLDHFGLEQMLWPKDYYAKAAETSIDAIDPKLPRYQFPKGSFLGDEEYIYVGPMRMEYAQCSTFIDRYPIRTSKEYMLDVIKSMKPDDEELGKNKVVGDGGFTVAATHMGVVSYQKGQRESFMGVEDIPIHDSKHINLNRLYNGLEEHAKEQGDELKDHIMIIKQDFIDKWPYEFHHGLLQPSDSRDGEGMARMYIKFYNRWKSDMKK